MRITIHCVIAGVFAAVVQAAFAAEPPLADVVVAAATPRGVTAAVSAARSGARVTVVEKSNHVGGIIAGGLWRQQQWFEASTSRNVDKPTAPWLETC